MNEKLRAAVETLLDELKQQVAAVADTKKTVNALLRRMGDEPMFDDVDPETIGTAALKPDSYYGKPFQTSVVDFLNRKGTACIAEEILAGLEQGGFDFNLQGWKEKDRLRSLAMTIAKNSRTFHRLPNGSFGLLSWYPEVERRMPRGRYLNPATEVEVEVPPASEEDVPPTMEAEAPPLG